MLAYRYHPGQNRVVKEEVKQPKAGPNEVVLRIRAAGVCHSDLHVLDGEVPFAQNVFTMGHEACGELVETGSEVPSTYKSGALYVAHGPNPCGDCYFCRTGKDNICNHPSRAPIGLGADGAYAEFLKLPARNIIEVPEGISPEVAAVSTDAVLTPYHALKTLANLRSGDTVLVLGLGGLGINGVQIASSLGATVIAADIRESSLALAKNLGASEVIPAQALEQSLKNRNIDVVADFVGRQATFQQAQSLVRPGGMVVLIGLGSPEVPLYPMTVAASEIRVQGSMWGTSVELREVLQAVAQGRIRPQVENGALGDLNHWLDELRQGRVRSRVALVPRAEKAKQPVAA